MTYSAMLVFVWLQTLHRNKGLHFKIMKDNVKTHRRLQKHVNRSQNPISGYYLGKVINCVVKRTQGEVGVRLRRNRPGIP